MSTEEDLDRLERAVLGRPRVRRFFDLVDGLRRALAREDPALRRLALEVAPPAVGRDLAAAVDAAWNLGVDDASIAVGGEPKGVPSSAPRFLIAAARKTERDVANLIGDARKLGRTGADPEAVASKVFAAGNALRRDVTTLVNQAGNAGTTAVADAAGRPTVWVAETNACVTCLAYSGIVAPPGKSFPAGRSYGPRSTMTEPAAYPPAHPHCRCIVEPLNDPEYASALRREADRSVLRGFSLESEPMRVRVEAAARLLERGVDAPKSVIAYAQRAVKAGEFPTRGRP